MSGEMLTFHETISKLQEAEDDMVEYHKHLFEMSAQWNHQHKMLINLTNQVEYDQEGKDRFRNSKRNQLCYDKKY